MVYDAGFFVFFEASKKFVFSVSSDKFAKGAYAELFVHTAAGERFAIPTSAKPLFFTAIEMLAPLFVFAAVMPASGAGLIFDADTAGKPAVSEPFFAVHTSKLQSVTHFFGV